MRLVTYDRGGARRLGAWVGGTVVDLPGAVGHPAFPTTMEALIALHGGTTLDAAREALSHPENVTEFRVPGARLLPPIVPISLLEHRWILGPEDRLPWPPGADAVDYQVEVACIVGQFCRDVSLEEASGVIFGYTLMNDWAARAGRVTKGGRGRRPRVDRFATSLGPCVVTADEFDPARGRLVARVDGKLWSEGDLGSARGTFPQLLAQFSAQQEMYPGDVLGSGTFPGGCAMDLGLTLRPGAMVQLEAEGIGALRNRVGFPQEDLQPAAASES
ncbi:MAG TPA: fumarylacetoacetate hydrolase family protein [Actinomycetota bacterium]|jgi:2-keto-4-pentenoate hydratase/2-oxohepta-3-ene-1,7-dioic acid hydratase in catechol pathway